MAIYQYTVELIPNGSNPFQGERLNVAPAWRDYAMKPEPVAKLIDEIIPRAKPFADEMFLWGETETDDLQLWTNRGCVVSLTARFNCVEPSGDFFARIAKVAATLGLSALMLDSRQIIQSPNAIQLAHHARKSDAAKNAREPFVEQAYHGSRAFAASQREKH